MSLSPTHSHSQPILPDTVPTPTPAQYPQFILFGDSITQASSKTLAAPLAEWYTRRLDILNRGFSGYTAPMGYDNLLQFFPSTPPSPTTPAIKLMTVFFGANDACVQGSPQHVPLERYKEYLTKIATLDRLNLHGTKIIMITPAPVDEWQFSRLERTATTTRQYVTACREVAQTLNLPVIDLWTIFMSKAGWTPNSNHPLIGSRDAPRSKVLGELLSDGLHFTAAAYRIVFDELVKLIREKMPELTPDNMPFVFPDWKKKLGLGQ
ncbi:SGNH hydrolase-type esterase domain-containing protein [Exophiala viscosa]|uniref:SGNH hydrolase-type esterase domain-containing protein n=1 Tax=Exophiala viscosa TaxID=2486360 RepID=A0AAN6I9H2_9EURO|nr:SGNH hydrolase-type esterase domain-containing protein [Exophiala viscosa]KAI1625405.1 SGNH hydrolase-type esterase domain-containing protein [Exophiala viscosa]